jgi:hypothetical protein
MRRRSQASGVGLDVEVRNLARNQDGATVEWYIFGKSVDGRQQFIFDQGKQPVTIPPAGSETVAIDSKSLVSNVDRQITQRTGYVDGTRATATAASTTRSGSKVAGWVVRLVADDQVLQVRASSPSLEAIGKNSAALTDYPRQVTGSPLP